MGDRPVLAVEDAYVALEEMSRRNWPVVVLSAVADPTESADFAGLCRASRRLQPQAKLYAVCPPRLEVDVRPLVGETLDGYFIHPLASSDLCTLAAEGPRQPAAAPAAVAAAPAGLPCGDFSRLVAATFSRMDLENCIAQIVSSRLHCRVEWVDQQSADDSRRVLLRVQAHSPRLLVAEAPVEADGPAAAMLAALGECLPALWSAARRSESLHHLAITDELTGAYNRRYFYHATDQILRQAAKSNHRATLLLYDIDNFKGYNDQYTYAVGDEILRETAVLMKRITRQHDIVARIGGDEFAVLFWDKDEPRSPGSKPPDSAVVLARRFIKALERHEFPSLGPHAVGALTISGGLASFPADGATCRELLRKANLAIKDAKQSGKSVIRIVGRLNESNTRPASDSQPGGKA